MTHTVILPDGLEPVHSGKLEPRYNVMLAGWISGENIPLITFNDCHLTQDTDFRRWLKETLHRQAKFVAYWVVRQLCVRTSFIDEYIYTSPGNLVGNVTIIKLSDGIIMKYAPTPQARILHLPNFYDPQREQYLEVANDTLLQLPERYTVMSTTVQQL